MAAAEIEGDYEANTGRAIVRRFARLEPEEVPAVLVAGHGPFCWGASAAGAAHTAVILEHVAQMAYGSLTLNPQAPPLPQPLLDRHFLRKHGVAATYGQK
jgi:L-ribulose-5-phosphate 4-epimerase